MILNRDRHNLGYLQIGVLILFLLVGCSQVTRQKFPSDSPEMIVANAAFIRAYERGKEIWFDKNLGTNGFNCEACHPGGELTNAYSYPRYKHVLGTMATLSMTHNFAVVNETRGKPWVLGSEDANAIALFVKSLSNGYTLRMAHAFRDEWVKKGKKQFYSSDLGTNGRSCNTCHQNGGKRGAVASEISAPSLKKIAVSSPGYSFRAQKIVTLEQEINICIDKYLEGSALALDDSNLVALTAYVTSLSEGERIRVKIHGN